MANHEWPMLISLLRHPHGYVDELCKNADQEQISQVVVLFPQKIIKMALSSWISYLQAPFV